MSLIAFQILVGFGDGVPSGISLGKRE